MTFQELDRTLFELIRLEVVAQGYLPDWRTIAGADLATKKANYELAKQAIRTAGKMIIEVFGVGVGEEREEKLANMIEVNRQALSVGTIGQQGIQYFKSQGDGFDIVESQGTTSIVSYEIRYFTNKTAYDRIIYGILDKALRKQLRVNLVDNSWAFTGPMAYFEFESWVDATTRFDMFERIWRLKAMDVQVNQEITVATDIVPIDTINMDLYLLPLNANFDVDESNGSIQDLNLAE
jgi:hypothetical protein